MPLFTKPDGTTTYIPGVYVDTAVASNLPGALPEYLIPVALGAAREGYPYNVGSLINSNEQRVSPFIRIGTTTAARAAFGGDCELTTAIDWAKRHGLGSCYAVCMGALTRASVVATSSTPTNQFTLYPKKFGAPGGHIKVLVTGGNKITITPVLRYSFLTADAASGATRLYVADNSWITEGLSLTIGDNNSANAAYVVSKKGVELSSTGQYSYWIELTSALAAAISTAQYGMVLIYDSGRPEAPDAFGSTQEMFDWINNESQLLGATKAGTWTGAALVNVSVAAIKDISGWGTVTPGTSPAPTASDYSSFVSLMDGSLWDQFIQDERVVPQCFLAITSSSTAHGTMRDWAVAKRTEGYPIRVFTGCAWGDVVTGASDDTNPTYRSANLNNQDIVLCAGGLSKQASCLSLAPTVWGLHVAGGLVHNLTQDLIQATEFERAWDERNSGELTLLHKKGVLTYRMSVGQGGLYVVSQGLSTLQTNASSWNVEGATTPLIMQRTLMDFLSRALKDNLELIQIGQDEVSKDTVGVAIVNLGNRLIKRGVLRAFRITVIELDETGAGWNADWAVQLPVTTDYIGVRTTVLVGE